MIINRYVKPNSVSEAYDLLNSTQNSEVIGGGAYIRLGKKNVDLAIDMCNTGLDFITEKDNTIEIGATTTFRQLEKSEILMNYYDRVIPKTVGDIMGVQMRNIVTVGGTIYGKYGFSDLITTLLALDCEVVTHKRGKIYLEYFLKEKRIDKDIIEKIIIKKDDRIASFQTMKNTSTDFSMINVAVCKKNDKYNIVVGARPAVATLAIKAMEYIESSKGDEYDAAVTGDIASKELIFGTDLRASKEYRKELCSVLVKRAIVEVMK
ncbi:FAD binding domain-containing protein [Clostridium algoriphilum]|uniref:FAD binding domain-containing protein n=1 Tax=Clostridium algoriphilum TaxID=198347 RepID=UPI001CF14CEC|nr:FAD binding domain-containing protein [Clostridium algoriphilum]MCB2293278.1 FAD binding domain-containing protein [Clostridium algoriphilum]